MNKQQLTHIASRVAWWSVTIFLIWLAYYTITDKNYHNCVETDTHECIDVDFR